MHSLHSLLQRRAGACQEAGGSLQRFVGHNGVERNAAQRLAVFDLEQVLGHGRRSRALSRAPPNDMDVGRANCWAPCKKMGSVRVFYYCRTYYKAVRVGGFFCEGLMNVLHVRFEKFVFEEKPANWIEKIEILAISEFEGHSVCVCVFLCFM